MKKILFFLLLLLCSALHAQEALEIITTPPPGYVTYDHAFAQLNTNQVTSGILIDRSTPFVNLERFSGATLSDTNKVNVNTFGLAYARLSGSVLDISDTLPSPKAVLGKLGKPADTIPLKILFYDYHRLKPDALTAGDIQVANNQILNVPGRNPFEAKTVFMAVPWVLPTVEGSSFIFRLQAPRQDCIVWTHLPGPAGFTGSIFRRPTARCANKRKS